MTTLVWDWLKFYKSQKKKKYCSSGNYDFLNYYSFKARVWPFESKLFKVLIRLFKVVLVDSNTKKFSGFAPRASRSADFQQPEESAPFLGQTG